MYRKIFNRFKLYTAIAATVAWAVPGGAQTKRLTVVYQNNDFQFTGISVSARGRMFLNFPRWSDKYLNAVVELMKDGSIRPYPDEEWNRWDMKPATAGNHFVCVQSVVADDAGSLWVVDAAAPLLASVVPGGAKVVQIDLGTNRVTRVFSMGADVVKPDSYLNDIRVDTKRNTAYLTDSGEGGIVVLDIRTGKAHRALDGDPAVKAQQGVSIGVNGKPVLDAKGKPPQFNSDGIALSHDGEYLYFQPITSNKLFRIRTELLRGGSTTSQGAGARAETFAPSFPVDGLWMDARDRLYLSNINESAVSRMNTRDPQHKIEKLASDPSLQWPDTFSEGPHGTIYITASHINDAPKYNHGKSTRTEPYTVFKLSP